MFSENFIASAKFEFKRYKNYGDKVIDQLSEEELFWQPSETDNSIAIIIKHLSGNMLSRWTNFLTEDGEKSWRNRDDEFEKPKKNRKEILKLWEKGWACLFDALNSVDDSNFSTAIRIRGQYHTIPEAVNRQLAHYASHIGQIVYLGKLQKKEDWVSPTIPQGQSKAFNQKMFGQNS
ncbi:MAG: DUF1572 family protein [Bacteroidota bacterium]